jgi:hypothetical protein
MTENAFLSLGCELSKIKILFLAANPNGTNKLALDEEIREITSKIRTTNHRDSIDLISAWAIRPDDLLQLLNMHRPQIVHFSVHGSNSGEIILTDNSGVSKAVSSRALQALFTTLKYNIRAVVLNACYSKEQAQAITQVIDCAVGMSNNINDKAAITFAASFYRAIGFGRSIKEAFDQGITALLLEGIPEEDAPELLVRESMDPSSIYLLDADNSETDGIPNKPANGSRIAREIEIKSLSGDITEIQADVVALKFARFFYGADSAVAMKLSDGQEQLDKLSPEIGKFSLVATEGKICAKKALFLGVTALSSFRYGEIYNFSKNILKVLKYEFPQVRTVALTIHGVGYGLDETESVISQIRGFLDSLKAGCFPPNLQCILIVDRNTARSNRIQKILENNLSFYRKGERILIPVNEFKSHLGRSRTFDLENAGFESEKKPHIFVAMPFSEDMEDIYYYGIQPSVHSAGFLCERVDLTAFTGDILDRIKSRIESSELVIADLTGANPNVYLEVGYAWGKGLPTILLSKDADDLKFDVRGQRCINYKRIRDLEKTLKIELRSLLNDGPLTSTDSLL